MKNLKSFSLFTLAILITVGCSKKENNDLAQISQTDLESKLEQNKWVVEYFEDRGKDETSDFTNYTIAFVADGSLVVSAGGEKAQFTGSWMLSGVSDDSSSSGRKLIMTISGNDIVRELDEDWKIIELTDSHLKLFDDSIDHTTYLNLVRI